MKEECLVHLNPYFTAARAVMEIPLVLAERTVDGETVEGEGKIIKAIEGAEVIVKIELKNSPQLDDDRKKLLSHLQDITTIDKKGTKVLVADYQGCIDTVKSIAELILVDEAIRCECKGRK